VIDALIGAAKRLGSLSSDAAANTNGYAMIFAAFVVNVLVNECDLVWYHSATSSTNDVSHPKIFQEITSITIAAISAAEQVVNGQCIGGPSVKI
jgi:hypothetical protein